MTGYRSSAEAISCKFPKADGTRLISDFSVGFNDGQLKVLTMMALVSFVHELDSQLKPISVSFVFPKRWLLVSLTWYMCPSPSFV